MGAFIRTTAHKYALVIGILSEDHNITTTTKSGKKSKTHTVLPHNKHSNDNSSSDDDDDEEDNDHTTQHDHHNTIIQLLVLYLHTTTDSGTERSDLLLSGVNTEYFRSAYITTTLELIPFDMYDGPTAVFRDPISVHDYTSKIQLKKPSAALQQQHSRQAQLPTHFTIDLQVDKWQRQQKE